MRIIHTLPLLIRSTSRENDLAMLIDCLNSLRLSSDYHLVIYNQGCLSPDELHNLLLQCRVSADVIGSSRNVGIAEARQRCFEFIYAAYPDVPYISEIHVDMLFPPHWYEPLIRILSETDEPLLCPAIVTAYGELQPLGQYRKLPASSAEKLQFLEKLPTEGLQNGFVHPVVHRAKALMEVGGYDTRFLRGKQGYEDDSLLLGYAYYMGTRIRWRPKCCLQSWVYHATLSQRMTLDGIHQEFQNNKEGLVAQYGAYGLRLLSDIHGNQSEFIQLFNQLIPPHRSDGSS